MHDAVRRLMARLRMASSVARRELLDVGVEVHVVDATTTHAVFECYGCPPLVMDMPDVSASDVHMKRNRVETHRYAHRSSLLVPYRHRRAVRRELKALGFVVCGPAWDDMELVRNPPLRELRRWYRERCRVERAGTAEARRVPASRFTAMVNRKLRRIGTKELRRMYRDSFGIPQVVPSHVWLRATVDMMAGVHVCMWRVFVHKHPSPAQEAASWLLLAYAWTDAVGVSSGRRSQPRDQLSERIKAHIAGSKEIDNGS